MAEGQPIILRLIIPDPVPGMAYSLQDKAGAPVDARIAGQTPVSFDVPIRLAEGPRFLGPFVRSEGPDRRFIYIAIGAMAGDAKAALSRRAKIDIHDIPAALLDKALAGVILEARLPGRDKKGDPACASLKPIDGWRAL